MVQAGFPYTDSISSTFRSIWSLFPPNPFAQALTLLSEAVATAEDDGVSWSRRGECAPNDEECVITIVCTDLSLTSKSQDPRSLGLAFPFYFLFHCSSIFSFIPTIPLDLVVSLATSIVT